MSSWCGQHRISDVTLTCGEERRGKTSWERSVLDRIVFPENSCVGAITGSVIVHEDRALNEEVKINEIISLGSPTQEDSSPQKGK